MGALQLIPSRAGTIRRVIRRGSQFICGLCRSIYAGEGHAQSCIQGCWRELMTLDPVIAKRSLVGVAFRCRFCARDFSTRPDAAVCADDCKSHQLRLHEAEQSLTEQSDDPPPRKATGKAPPKLKAVKSVAALAAAPKASRKKAATKEILLNETINADVISSSSVAPDAESTRGSNGTANGSARGGAGSGSGGGTGRVVKESDMIHGIGTGSYSKKKDEHAVQGVGSGPYSKKSEGEADSKKIEAGPNKLKTSDAFFRDGARYVCNGCQVKYFTRGEVEACFAGHT